MRLAWGGRSRRAGRTPRPLPQGREDTPNNGERGCTYSLKVLYVNAKHNMDSMRPYLPPHPSFSPLPPSPCPGESSTSGEFERGIPRDDAPIGDPSRIPTPERVDGCPSVWGDCTHSSEVLRVKGLRIMLTSEGSQDVYRISNLYKFLTLEWFIFVFKQFSLFLSLKAPLNERYMVGNNVQSLLSYNGRTGVRDCVITRNPVLRGQPCQRYHCVSDSRH